MVAGSSTCQLSVALYSLVSVCRGVLVRSCAATVGTTGMQRQGVDETGGLLPAVLPSTMLSDLCK